MAKRVPPGSGDKPPKKPAPRQPPNTEPAFDDLQAIFGQNLKIARLKREMTLVELAEAAGMQFSYVSRIENGEKNVTLDTMKRLAAVVGLDVSAMLRLSGTELEPTPKKSL